jgi:hypothetical protein
MAHPPPINKLSLKLAALLISIRLNLSKKSKNGLQLYWTAWRELLAMPGIRDRKHIGTTCCCTGFVRNMLPLKQSNNRTGSSSSSMVGRCVYLQLSLQSRIRNQTV